MNLFGNTYNILPFDGETIFHSGFIAFEETQSIINQLTKEITWENEKFNLYGKEIIVKRKSAWFAENNLKYTYSKITRTPQNFIPILNELKQRIEIKSGAKFNSCLANLYHNGNEGMSWHADDEKELGLKPIIASLSLGASRRFSFKHNETKRKVDLNLNSGDLLIMKGETQKNWVHALPKSKKVTAPRLNLTFRFIHDPHLSF